MIHRCICKSCQTVFKGGPRAWYCPSCREDRKRDQKVAYMRRKAKGHVREIGGVDKCQSCGKEYIINAAAQMYCPECRIPMHAEKLREQSLDYYYKNRDDINPLRLMARRKDIANCAWCGKEYISHTRAKGCSPECLRKLKNQRWLENYHKKKNAVPGGSRQKEDAMKKAILRHDARGFLLVDASTEEVILQGVDVGTLEEEVDWDKVEAQAAELGYEVEG